MFCQERRPLDRQFIRFLVIKLSESIKAFEDSTDRNTPINLMALKALKIWSFEPKSSKILGEAQKPCDWMLKHAPHKTYWTVLLEPLLSCYVDLSLFRHWISNSETFFHEILTLNSYFFSVSQVSTKKLKVIIPYERIEERRERTTQIH